MRKLILVGALVASLSAAAAAGVYAFSWYQTSPMSWPERPFAAQAWQASQPQERYLYYRSLKSSGLLEVATLAEVKELLGPPDFEAPDGCYIDYVVKRAEPGELSLNFLHLLTIRFDQGRGTVESYDIRAD